MLSYVDDQSLPGITRKRKGRYWMYFHPDGSRVTDREEIDRLNGIGMPPAYERCWFCPKPNGHIQATGYDARGRKQYRYHPDFRAQQDSRKYERLAAFGEALPKLRKRIDEDSELMEPRRRLLDAGAEVTLASLDTQEIEGDKGEARIKPDLVVDQVDASDYDALLLPGGTKNPDKLRTNRRVVETVERFASSGKPVAAICHGPWLLVEADVVRGRRVTGWPSIRTDLRNAGADVVDEEAVTDGNFVTSRKPEDIHAFVEAFVALVEKADAPVA